MKNKERKLDFFRCTKIRVYDVSARPIRRSRFGAGTIRRRDDSALVRFGAWTIRRRPFRRRPFRRQLLRRRDKYKWYSNKFLFYFEGNPPPQTPSLMGGIASLDHPPHILKITQTVKKIFKFMNQFRSERKRNIAV